MDIWWGGRGCVYTNVLDSKQETAFFVISILRMLGYAGVYFYANWNFIIITGTPNKYNIMKLTLYKSDDFN